MNPSPDKEVIAHALRKLADMIAQTDNTTQKTEPRRLTNADHPVESKEARARAKAAERAARYRARKGQTRHAGTVTRHAQSVTNRDESVTQRDATVTGGWGGDSASESLIQGQNKGKKTKSPPNVFPESPDSARVTRHADRHAPSRSVTVPDFDLSATSPAFQTFFAAFPCDVYPERAWAQWTRQGLDDKAEQVMAQLESWKNCDQWKGRVRFVGYACNWLDGKWKSDPPGAEEDGITAALRKRGVL